MRPFTQNLTRVCLLFLAITVCVGCERKSAPPSSPGVELFYFEKPRRFYSPPLPHQVVTTYENTFYLLTVGPEPSEYCRLSTKTTEQGWDEQRLPDLSFYDLSGRSDKLIATDTKLISVNINKPRKGKGTCRVTFRELNGLADLATSRQVAFMGRATEVHDLVARADQSFAFIQLDYQGNYSGKFTPDLGENWKTLQGTLPFPESRVFPPDPDVQPLLVASNKGDLRLIFRGEQEVFEYWSHLGEPFQLYTTAPNGWQDWLGSNLTRPEIVYRCYIWNDENGDEPAALVFTKSDDLKEGWERGVSFLSSFEYSIEEVWISGKDDLIVVSWLDEAQVLRYCASGDNGESWSPPKILEFKDFRISGPDSRKANRRLSTEEICDVLERKVDTRRYSQYFVGEDVVFVRSQHLERSLFKELAISWGKRL